MKIIKPSVEFFGAVPTDYTNALRFIEMAGRTCYKSEDKITADSAEGFVKRLISAEHLAMVEHSNFVIRRKFIEAELRVDADMKAIAGKYLTHLWDGDYDYIGGNLTAWAQIISKEHHTLYSWHHSFLNQWGRAFNLLAGENIPESDWQICPHNEIPPSMHRYSAKFICDRGVSHELVRHRPCSFAQESTRYVNYGGKDMEFIEPAGFGEWNGEAIRHFTQACDDAEERYNHLLNHGDLSPQQARAVLPNALKTEIVVTADASEWAHIKKLRTHPSAHPDMVRVMNMMSWEEMGI